MPDSLIAFLPNTIYYGKSEKEQKKFQKFIRIYNGHPNLRVYAWKQMSYAYCNIRLILDMVLSLNPCGESRERRG